MITFASYRTFRELLLVTGAQGEQPACLSTEFRVSSVVSQTVSEISFFSRSSPYSHPPPGTRQPRVGYGLRILVFSRSRSDTPHSVGLLWTGDEPDAETSTWKHTALRSDSRFNLSFVLISPLAGLFFFAPHPVTHVTWGTQIGWLVCSVPSVSYFR